MAEKQFLTKKGYDERVARLEELKVVRRKEVAQKLKEAREQGDLSENAEYDAAKDEQRDIETEIAELEAILANCEVIQDNDKNKDVVKMESVVVLHDVEFDEDIEYTIVGSSEADSLNNKISNESPLGAALIGKKKGDTVKVEAPVGAGHAGCEAALAAARLGMKTLVFSISLENIANMPCNPHIGGSSKGHLVREIDALGGEMGKNIDKSMIQIKMLNTSKGPAVHSLRAQADRKKYQMEMKHTLELQENLCVKQGEIVDIIVENNKITAVKTAVGAIYRVKAVILATGTYLKSKIYIGEFSHSYKSNSNLLAQNF